MIVKSSANRGFTRGSTVVSKNPPVAEGGIEIMVSLTFQECLSH